MENYRIYMLVTSTYNSALTQNIIMEFKGVNNVVSNYLI